MIKGRKSLYNALMDAFDEGEEFTLDQATAVHEINIWPIRDGWIKSNVCKELARFVIDRRAKKVKHGVYMLTPRMIDYEHALLVKPKAPRVIQMKGQKREIATMVNRL